MNIKKGILLASAFMLVASNLCACNGNEKNENGVTESAVSEPAHRADNLKDAYKDWFSVGVAINTYQLRDKDQLELITKEFNSITMENEMKPESILDWQKSEESKDGTPAINTERLDQVLTLAKDNGLKLRGHTLVWHSQTPSWFFCKNFDDSKGRVDKRTMLVRMEGYIKKVITYCQDNYPGVVYAWDVVNEGAADGGGYRMDSPWYEIIGEEYLEKAFEYARKYATEDVKLFYNDYNTYEADKRNFIAAKVKLLAEKKLIDGVGMQSHWSMDYPSVRNIQTALETYSEIDGIEVQLTEIDMHNTDNSEQGLQAQAERYKEIFDMILSSKKEGKANVTSVTFWGLSDDVTWLTNFKGETSYPLLFNENLEKKPAYNSLLDVAKK